MFTLVDTLLISGFKTQNYLLDIICAMIAIDVVAVVVNKKVVRE